MKIGSYGVLLTNIGSPDAPTPQAVKTYLKKFLSDKRVVEIPRFLWWIILNGFILRTRPKKSAELYKKIWTTNGSPLTYTSEQLAKKLQAELGIPVEIGMHYGNPSIQVGLENLRAKKIKKIFILPMYPQYSGATSASTFDQVADVLRDWREIPEIIYLNQYHTHVDYIQAICDSVPNSFEHLLFSFHGIPKRFIDRGDPYEEQCYKTANLIAEKLQLSKDQWTISFQSRLGRAEWLKPYTEKVLSELPTQGITNLHVICPGFAIDCLETLEEIALRGKEQFLQAGGKSFTYISALNDSANQVAILNSLIRSSNVFS